jgi:phage tail-like protein
MATARRIFPTYRIVAGFGAVLFILAGGRLMSVATQTDLPRYSFAVTIEGRELGAFREVTGLDTEIEVIEYREGSGGPIQKIPGQTKYSPIKLTRGFTGDRALQDWFTEFLESRSQRVGGSIVMLDQTRSEIARWNFQQAWPSKITGPTLNADGNEVATESITLAHEGLLRVLR